LSSFIFSSCYYDKEELLYPKSSCEKIGNISYSIDIVPVLSKKCYACHDQINADSKGNGLRLDTYFSFKSAIAEANLIKAINHQSGAVKMPKNASKLSECEISTIETWSFEGNKNN
jgi:hypothetical protein